MKSLKGILGGIRQADQQFTFFEEKDCIMVGISGGKDSMVLFYALAQYQKFNFVNFKIIPAILDLGFPGFDATEMSSYFKKLGYDLKIIDATDVYKILKIQQKDSKILPCSICSRMKKAAINKAAKALGCNKVAFAHHADDAIETLFLNEIYGGRVATFQPKMHLERIDIEFIRPLILVREHEIIACQKEEHIPSFPSHCPNDGNTKRAEMKSLLKDIYKKYPSAEDNFLTMLSNYQKEKLFYDDIFIKIERKDISFKPIIRANDLAIAMKLTNDFIYQELNDSYLIYKKNKPIGVYSCQIKCDNQVDINQFFLKTKSENTFKSIFKYIENSLFRKINPIDIDISFKNYHKELKDIGYKKTHNSGLSKKID